MIGELILVLVLILLNGFFAMAELAVVSSRKMRLQQLVDDGKHGARVALELLEKPARFLSSVQIGITLIGIIAGAYGGATLAAPLGRLLADLGVATAWAEGAAFTLVVLVITYLSLVVGELIPKQVALQNPERVAAAIAPTMRLLARVGSPVVWVLETSARVVLRLFGVRERPEETVSEEEVRALIAEGTETGVFEEAESQMIERVLQLADRPVRSIMTPRPEVEWLDIDDPPEVMRDELRRSRYSRFPVARGEIDHLLGVVLVRDLFERVLDGGPLDLAAVLHPPMVVPEGIRILRLLEEFKKTSLHMAAVVDEYGGFAGIVTMADVLEAIAGDIPEPGDTQDPDAVQRPDGSWLLDGALAIDEVEERLGLHGMRTDKDDFVTLAGFVLARLQRLPEIAETFDWNGAHFEVVDMDGRRIDRVLVTPPPPPTKVDEE